LHDDGSLTDSDIQTLEKHLINVKVVRKSSADALIKEHIAGLPNCCEYRFTAQETSDHRGIKYDMHIFAVRLFDFNLIANGTKTLVLDADVLFFKRPSEIIEWAEDAADRNSLYSVEQYIPQRNRQSEIIGYALKTPRPTDANAGLLCFDKRAFSLEALENWIGANKEKMNTYATFEQAAYNHLVKTKGGSAPLPDTYSFNYTDQDVIATHFAIKILFFKNLKRLEKALH
jgi:lipopolysaccharide biosynthesis glycosyltransferase